MVAGELRFNDHFLDDKFTTAVDLQAVCTAKGVELIALGVTQKRMANALDALTPVHRVLQLQSDRR